MKVQVVRSHRRRKTIQARVVDGVIQVHIPATFSQAEEERWVAQMVERIERRRASDHVDLSRRADALATRYGLPRPTTITWSDRQNWRWGSCTPSAGTIRVSSRLAQEPLWVLDYVIMHELVHLVEGPHSTFFWALVGKYPLTERARGFLLARGLQQAGDDPADGPGQATDSSGDPDQFDDGDWGEHCRCGEDLSEASA